MRDEELIDHVQLIARCAEILAEIVGRNLSDYSDKGACDALKRCLQNVSISIDKIIIDQKINEI